MTLEEFKAQSELAITRNHVKFHFTQVRDYLWLLEVILDTLPQEGEDEILHDHIEAQTTMTSVEAYYAYKNILDSGLE